MDFQKIVSRAQEIREKYRTLEKSKYGREWTKEEIAQGFVGDVGDLIKLVSAKSGVRQIDNLDSKMAHELSDCLWCVIILAKEYKIDLEKSFLETMNELERKMN